MGACCFCACIFKMILGILNMLLLMFGALTAGIGGILLVMADSAFVQDLVRIIVVPVLEKLYGEEFVVGAVAGNFKELLSPVSWALIVIGCILIVIAIFGYVGLSLNINICLGIYATLIGLMIFIQIILLALIFTGALNKQIEKGLVTTLEDHYQDANGTNIWSLSWNLIMLRFNCCGASNYKDFQGELRMTKKWPKDLDIKISGVVFREKFDMPIFCCKTEGVFPSLNITDPNCVKESSSNNNKDMGCRQAIWDEIHSVRTQFLTFAIFAILLQVVILVMLFIIMQENKIFPEK